MTTRMLYHERLRACLENHIQSDMPLTLVCAALGVKYGDVRAVTEGVPIRDIADPSDQTYHLISHDFRDQLSCYLRSLDSTSKRRLAQQLEVPLQVLNQWQKGNLPCIGQRQLCYLQRILNDPGKTSGIIQSYPVEYSSIPVHDPSAAPGDRYQASWPIIAHTAAPIDIEPVCGLVIKHKVDGWSIGPGSVMICVQQLMPICWLRLDCGWTIARAASRGRWAGAGDAGYYNVASVKWWLGIVEVRYALPYPS